MTTLTILNLLNTNGLHQVSLIKDDSDPYTIMSASPSSNADSANVHYNTIMSVIKTAKVVRKPNRIMLQNADGTQTLMHKFYDDSNLKNMQTDYIQAIQWVNSQRT